MGPLSVASSYTIKDTTTDLSAYEVAATYKLLTVGYGDLEGTGNYKTVGVSKSLTKGFLIYLKLIVSPYFIGGAFYLIFPLIKFNSSIL